MKLPRRFVTKLSLAAVLAASAALGWAAPEATAGLLPAATTTFTKIGSAQIIPQDKPHPSVTVLAVFKPHAISLASAQIDYSFQVTGPPNREPPLEIAMAVAYTVRDVEQGESFFQVGADVAKDKHILIGVSAGSPSLQRFATESDTVEFTVATNTVHTVTAFAVATVADNDLSNTGLNAQASVDPVISFAPGFDHTGFSIEVSPGIGNSFSSSVPEPSTLVVSSILFATFGAVWVYKQRKQTTEPAGISKNGESLCRCTMTRRRAQRPPKRNVG